VRPSKFVNTRLTLLKRCFWKSRELCLSLVELLLGDKELLVHSRRTKEDSCEATRRTFIPMLLLFLMCSDTTPKVKASECMKSSFNESSFGRKGFYCGGPLSVDGKCSRLLIESHVDPESVRTTQTCTVGTTETGRTTETTTGT